MQIWRMDRVFDATKPQICHERKFVSSEAAEHRGAAKLGTAAGRQHAGTRASSGQHEGGNTGAARRQQRTQPTLLHAKG